MEMKQLYYTTVIWEDGKVDTLYSNKPTAEEAKNENAFIALSYANAIKKRLASSNKFETFQVKV